MTIRDSLEHVGETVQLNGWVSVRRDHGKLIFIDLRDRSGVIQVVFSPDAGEEVYASAKKLRSEWVVRVTGLLKERPDHLKNADIPSGSVELEAQGLEILNEAQTPVFDVLGDGYDIGEEHRMESRYLDLRRPRLHTNLALRHKVVAFIRSYLDAKGFYEIETPILTRSTPEGARDYVVPSRLYGGKFYALPQAPQQYKQLLMVGGFEKYFQIARCFRDEDTRGDRQPEFTQLDMEMSFVEQEDIMRLNEELLIALVGAVAPEKKIRDIPFPRIGYGEAMEKYGTDRPDLRADKNDPDELAFCWVVDFPFFEKTKEGSWTFTHNPFSSPKPEYMDALLNKKDIDTLVAAQYDIVLNGNEIGGGSIRNHRPEALRSVLEIIGYTPEAIEENFGHMLRALGSGAPPHGGIAWGLDRLLMVLCGEESIREVIAFPKTGDARDLLMESPAALEKKQLDELHIAIQKENTL